MFKFVSILVLLFASTSFAQDKAFRNLFNVPADADRGMAWVELHFPVTENGGFDDAYEEQVKKSTGLFGVGIGRQIFKINDNDKLLMKVLKSVGVNFDINILNSPKYSNGLVATNTYAVEGAYCAQGFKTTCRFCDQSKYLNPKEAGGITDQYLCYDQKVYVKNLKRDLKNKGILVKIVRLKPFKKGIYKNHLLRAKNKFTFLKK